MSQSLPYSVGVKTKRITGFGLRDTSRQIARRWQDIIDRVGSFEPLAPANHSPSLSLAHARVPRRWHPFIGAFKRPLAA